jgi:hypothetical protein
MGGSDNDTWLVSVLLPNAAAPIALGQMQPWQNNASTSNRTWTLAVPSDIINQVGLGALDHAAVFAWVCLLPNVAPLTVKQTKNLMRQ